MKKFKFYSFKDCLTCFGHGYYYKGLGFHYAHDAKIECPECRERSMHEYEKYTNEEEERYLAQWPKQQ